MKKYSISLLFVSFFFTSSSQNGFNPYPIEDGIINFSEVVESNDSSAVLFEYAHEFLLDQDFYGPAKVICKSGRQLNQPIVSRKSDIVDPNTGIIAGKGFYIINYGSNYFFTLNFDYEIKVKDRVYRYELSNFYIYEYKRIPKYATKLENLNIPFEEILHDTTR